MPEAYLHFTSNFTCQKTSSTVFKVLHTRACGVYFQLTTIASIHSSIKIFEKTVAKKVKTAKQRSASL